MGSTTRVKAGVGAVNEDVGGELTREQAADVPADVAVHVGGASFATALIANHAGVVEGHVEGMGGREANGRGGVGGTAHGGTSGAVRAGRGEEVSVGGGGV